MIGPPVEPCKSLVRVLCGSCVFASRFMSATPTSRRGWYRRLFRKIKNLAAGFFVSITSRVFFWISIDSATALGFERLLHSPQAGDGADCDMSPATPCGLPRAMIRFLHFARLTSLKESFNFRLPGTWPTTRRTSGSGNKKPNNDSLPRQRVNDTSKQF